MSSRPAGDSRIPWKHAAGPPAPGAEPGCNRQAIVYWWTTVPLRAAALTRSVLTLTALPPWTVAQIAAGMVIAVLPVHLPVRIPHSTHFFAAGEALSSSWRST